MRKASSELRVVLLTGQSDPNDQSSPIPAKLFGKAVNDHLLSGLGLSEQLRVGVFRHRSLTIHSKTSIVDDNWALVGSANSMRRSLYTDFEHSVAFMDEDNLAVADYRNNLWSKYFNHSVADSKSALDLWFAIPYRGSGSPPHPSNIERLRIPFTVTSSAATSMVIRSRAVAALPLADDLPF